MDSLIFVAMFAGLYLYCIRTDGGLRAPLMMYVNDTPVDPSRIQRATSFTNRRVGLLNSPGLALDQGLLLDPATMVHTRGMPFPIDIVFLDRAGKVLAVTQDVAPDVKRLKGPRGTRRILELAAGAVGRAVTLQVGDRVEVR